MKGWILWVIGTGPQVGIVGGVFRRRVSRWDCSGETMLSGDGGGGRICLEAASILQAGQLGPGMMRQASNRMQGFYLSLGR